MQDNIWDKLKEEGDKNKSNLLNEENKIDKSKRDYSWFYCYSKFYNAHYKLKKYTTEELALTLMYYLGSWGMFRNSFLMEYSYVILEPVVEIILDEKYNKLWNVDDNLDKESFNEVISKIKNKLIKYNDNKNITDTLISKILMGTFCCCPAYDTKVLEAIGEINESLEKEGKKEKISKTFNYTSVNTILKLFNNNIQEFIDELKEIKENNINIPTMRIIDMCLWGLGNNK